jgi:acetyl-CoA carboxylase biotin carboxyl carrier protein
MDRDVIKQLIEALAATDLVELEYRSNGETLRLVKRAAVAAAPTHVVPPQHGGVTLVPASSSPSRSEPEAVVSDAIVAPAYGIVHLQETRGAPPLVAPGQLVTAGQVLCFIEAMKVFSEVRAERDGKITAVLVQSGQEVEAGQSLFQLD